MRKWTNDSMLRKIFPGLLILMLILGCEEVPPNSPPEILEIITYPASPKAGQEVSLTAVTSDEEDDVLSYRWIASGGAFEDSLGANPIQWRAPTDTGTISIFLQVSDGEGTSSETYTFSLESGVGTVAGHVKDASTGYLLEGVDVIISGETVTTGADGYFYFSQVVSGSNIPLSAEADNYVTFAELIDVEVEENIRDISMSLLTEVGRVAGYVTDSVTGLKLPGVRVQTGQIESFTGTDGYYELYNVPISANVPIRASLDGYLIFSELHDVVAGYNTNDIELQPSIATLSGRITSSSDGRVLSGAIITVNQYADTSNAVGLYELENIPATSNASITVSLEGYTTHYSTLDITGGTITLNLQLSDNTANLGGWIQSSLDASALANVTIQVGEVMATSSSDGHFMATGLPLGPNIVICTTENYSTYTGIVTLTAGSNDLNISMDPSVGNIQGYLRDGYLNISLPNQQISCGSLITTSGSDGYYEFLNVPLGDHQVNVELPGFQSFSSIVDITVGNNSINILLQPSTAHLIGTIKDHFTGLSLSGAVVSIGDIKDTTDSEGVYSLASVPLGANQVSCELPHHFTVSEVLNISLGSNTHDMELFPSVGTLLGIVRDEQSGMVIAGASISIGDSMTVTDATGNFSLGLVPLGLMGVEVNQPGYYPYTEYIDIQVGQNALNVELESSLGTVMGYVRDASSNQPLDSIMVILDEDTTMTQANGLYSFEDVPVDTDVPLQASGDGYVPYTGWTDILSGDNVVDLTLAIIEEL